MADRVSKEQRSLNMSKVKGKNTSLEIRVRKYLFAEGLRYKIHYKLPGKPDLVFTRKKVVVFVNGCFWHGHDCPKAQLPSSNTDFWKEKIEGNIVRDAKNIEKLNNLGWQIITVWECEAKKDFEIIMQKLITRLNA